MANVPFVHHGPTKTVKQAVPCHYHRRLTAKSSNKTSFETNTMSSA